MASAPRTGSTSVGAGVPAKQVYATAGTCLVIGLAIGYFSLGSHATPSVAQSNSAASAPNAAGAYNGLHPQLTIEQMKQTADARGCWCRSPEFTRLRTSSRKPLAILKEH